MIYCLSVVYILTNNKKSKQKIENILDFPVDLIQNVTICQLPLSGIDVFRHQKV